MSRLLRILLFLLGGWIIWFFLRKWYVTSFQQPSEEAMEDSQPLPPLPEKMLRCAVCGVHVPESEAIRSGEATFCCQTHKTMADGGM